MIIFYGLICSLIYWLTYVAAQHGMTSVDFSVLLDRSYRIFIGLVPYRDFASLTPPITYQIQAFLFHLFGPGIRIFLHYLSLQNVFFFLINILFCQYFLKLGFKKTLWLIPFIVLWLPGLHFPLPWYDLDPFAFSAMELICLMLARDSKQAPQLLIGAGILAALSFFCKQNIGAAAIVLAFPFFWLTPEALSDKLKKSAWFLAGVGLITSLVFAYFKLHQALPQFLDWVFIRAFQNQVEVRTSLTERALIMFFSQERIMIKFFIVIYALGLAGGWLCDRKILEQTWKGFGVHLCLGLFVFAHMFLGALSQLGGNFWYQQAFLGIALALVLKGIDPLGKTGRTIAIGAGLLLLALFIRTEKISARYRHTPVAMEDPAFKGLYASKGFAQELEILKEFNAQIPADQAVMTMDGFFYFMTKRTQIPLFLTCYDGTPEVMPQDMENAAMSLLQNKVRWAILKETVAANLPPDTRIREVIHQYYRLKTTHPKTIVEISPDGQSHTSAYSIYELNND